MNQPQRWIVAGQVLALLAVALLSMATSTEYSPCHFGGAPFPGQTAFPVDGAITLVTPALGDDAPQISDRMITLTLQGDAGQEEPVSVRVTRDTTGASTPLLGVGAPEADYTVWRVVPDQPLQPDAHYVLAVSYYALRTGHYTASDPAWDLSMTQSWEWRRPFHTGSAPRLLSAALPASGDTPLRRTLRLVFSEPMDVGSLADGRLRVDFHEVNPADRNARLAPVTLPLRSAPAVSTASAHRVSVDVDTEAMEGRVGALTLTVAPGAKALTGVALGKDLPHDHPNDNVVVSVSGGEDPSRRDLLDGRVTCTSF